jgi:hypothetical protein
MGKVAIFQAEGAPSLGLAPSLEAALGDFKADAANSVDDLVRLADAVRGQASALSRIQTTLDALLAHLAPELATKTTAPDPIGAGYSLSQADLAKALGLSSADVSVLCRVFKLPAERECAMVVRAGARAIVNYHPRAIDRRRALIAEPPGELDAAGRAALKRVQKKLAAAT